MPKTAKPQTPGAVLQKFIEDYQTNPFALSKSLKVTYQTVTHIIKGMSRITVQMALRLSQYFGNSPKYWLDIQASSEIDELSSDRKFLSEIKNIPRAEKPSGKAKAAKKKTNTLAEKRNKAAKVPGAKKPRGKKAGRPAKK